MTSLDTFRAQLDARGVRYDDASDQLLIDCPSHRSDSGTSLRAQYVDGRVLLHCFAGCETESVLGALGLSYRDLFDAPLPPGTVRGHTYADASGQLVGLQTKQPLPDGKKRFTPITRDPKTGAWRTRASDELKRTPYRLPEVLAAIAQGQPVWVVEGERDADSLWSHGVAATCNLNGAGKWNDAHARVLTGADVVVCQDYDEPGDKHRDAVFESLLDVAATVKLVRPAHGKDITDHLDAGYALAQVVEVDPPARFTDTPAPSSWEPVDLSIVLADGYEPPRAEIGAFGGSGGLFYAGEVNTIAGPSGTGKSWIAAAVVAEQLTAGKPCLYVDHESTAGVIAHRLQLLGVPRESILRHLTYVAPADPHTLAGDEWTALLVRRFEVAVIDGVTAAMALYGGGTNEQDAVAQWFVGVPTPLARRTGAAVITVDHTSKTGESSGFAVGSQHKRAAVTGVSYNVSAKVPMAPGAEGELHLTIGKDRHGDVSTRAIVGEGSAQIGAILRFDATGDGVEVRRDGVLVVSTERTRDTIRRNIRVAVAAPMSFNAIAKAVRGKRETIREIVDEMVEVGDLVVTDGSRGGGKMYSTAADSPTGTGSLVTGSPHPLGGVRGEPVPAKEVVPLVPPSDLGGPVREPLREPVRASLVRSEQGTTSGDAADETYDPRKVSASFDLTEWQREACSSRLMWTGLDSNGVVIDKFDLNAFTMTGTRKPRGFLVTYEEWVRRMKLADKWVDPTPGFEWSPLDEEEKA